MFRRERDELKSWIFYMYLNDNSRKDFLKKAAAVSIAGGAAGLLGLSARSLMPNVLYEPDRKVKIGAPTRFSEGVTFLNEHRLFVIKAGNNYRCMSAVCTHLGCTLKADALGSSASGARERQFRCPCHGSEFNGDGVALRGPVPSDLPRYHLSLAPDGTLVADLNCPVEKDFFLNV